MQAIMQVRLGLAVEECGMQEGQHGMATPHLPCSMLSYSMLFLQGLPLTLN